MPQLADYFPAVPVGQDQVHHRHIQRPVEASSFERLPGLGHGARLGDYLELWVVREQEGEDLAEGRVVLHHHDPDCRARAQIAP